MNLSVFSQGKEEDEEKRYEGDDQPQVEQANDPEIWSLPLVQLKDYTCGDGSTRNPALISHWGMPQWLL